MAEKKAGKLTLIPTKEQFLGWSLPTKYTALGFGLTVIGLIFTVYTTYGFNQDARESLASKGIEWSYENFISAIRSEDFEAIELFAKAGMKLDKNHFESLVNNYLNPKASDLFIEHGVVSSEHCPVTFSGMEFYKGIQNNTTKSSFTKALCSSESVFVKLEVLLENEKLSLEERRDSNQQRNARVISCTSDLAKTEPHDFYNEASRFVITSVNTYTIRQEVLAKLNIEILMGSEKLLEPEKYLRETINEVCIRNNPLLDVSEERVIAIEEVLGFLRT